MTQKKTRQNLVRKYDGLTCGSTAEWAGVEVSCHLAPEHTGNHEATGTSRWNSQTKEVSWPNGILVSSPSARFSF